MNMQDADIPARILKDFGFWFRRWRDRPLLYVIEFLGETPTHQQAAILRAFEHHHFVAVKSGHGIGKSKLMSWLAHWWLDTRGKTVPVTGANANTLASTVFKEIDIVNRQKPKWFGDRYVITRGPNTGEIKCIENPSTAHAVLRASNSSKSEALQGFHDCFYEIDEASGVKKKVFEVVEGALGDPGNYGLMTGNPTQSSGYFFDAFNKRQSLWYCMTFSSADSLAEETYRYWYTDCMGRIVQVVTHGRQTTQWIEMMKDKYGEKSNVYRVRVLGEFENMGRDSVIESRFMKNVFQDDRTKDEVPEIIMGVDPAWTGNDDTGVVIRRGRDIIYAENWNGFDLVDSFEKLKVIYDTYDCTKIVIDAIGVGAGLYDMFNHAIYHGSSGGYNAVKVIVSEKAPDDVEDRGKCRTLRDWLWWASRLFYRKYAVRYYEENKTLLKLRDELQEPTYRIKDKDIIVESKDEMRERGLKSPNLADAHNLTLYDDDKLFDEHYITEKQQVRSHYYEDKEDTGREYMSC